MNSPKLITKEGEHPIYDAEGLHNFEVIEFLFKEDLPEDFSLQWKEKIYGFNVKTDRMYFALGIQAVDPSVLSTSKEIEKSNNPPNNYFPEEVPDPPIRTRNPRHDFPGVCPSKGKMISKDEIKEAIVSGCEKSLKQIEGIKKKNKPDVIKRVNAIIENYSNGNDIFSENKLESLGIDDLDIVFIISDIEDEFKINLLGKEDDINVETTFQKIYDIISDII